MPGTVACPSRGELAAWSVGRCPAGRIEEIAGHLEGCDGCASSLGSLNVDDDPWSSGLRIRAVDDPILAEPGCRIALSQFEAIVHRDLPPPGDGVGPELPAGTRLGAYKIVGPLGRGGMGAVYRARHTLLKRDV